MPRVKRVNKKTSNSFRIRRKPKKTRPLEERRRELNKVNRTKVVKSKTKRG